MAQIFERFAETPAVKASKGEAAMKMSASITVAAGAATFFLGSGSTGYTCNGTFAAAGMPDGKYDFAENDGRLQIEPNVDLKGTFGCFVLNMNSIMSQKGVLSIGFVTQVKDEENMVTFFTTPQQLDKTLEAMPDLQSAGWAGWSGPV